MKNEIKLFEESKIRSVYDEEKDLWYFSVIDVIAILSESKEPKRYWSDLKRKMHKEAGSDQPYEKIVQLKMLATDDKMRLTDSIMLYIHTVMLNLFQHLVGFRNKFGMTAYGGEGFRNKFGMTAYGGEGFRNKFGMTAYGGEGFRNKFGMTF